jgi:hypothetical protein
MNVPDHLSGKKVRCPGCKEVTIAASPEVAVAPPPLPGAARPAGARHRAASAGAAPASPPSAMRCAACKAAAVQALPPNQFSRRPGYVCKACGAVMRPPGSGGLYVFLSLVGILMIPLGLFLAVFSFQVQTSRNRLLGFGVALAALGAAVASWCAMQLRLPIPLDAPVRPSRLGLWIGLFLLGLLLVGVALFGFMYFLHEM